MGGLVLGIALRAARARESWAGRWAFVGEDLQLELDASGLLGCFYRHTGEGIWVSSSAAILREIEPRLPFVEPPLIPFPWGTGSYPLPRSGVLSVGKLLPSQVLHVRSGEIHPRRLLPERPAQPVQRTLDELAEIVVDLVTDAKRRFPDLWVALSGGGDSRLVLAAAHAAGVRVTAYTFDKPGLITRADRELPPRLAAALGLEHRLIEPSPDDDRRLAQFELHTADHTREVDREYVVRRQWNRVPPSALGLGGAVWEVGRCIYHQTFDEMLPDESSEAGRWFGEWIAWVNATPQPALDWRDRFCIEQKEAGWRGSLEQGIDITGRQRVHIANCAGVFGRLLALPVELRRSGDHRRELIRMLAPELSHFPVNPPDPTLARLRHRVRGLRRRGQPPWP